MGTNMVSLLTAVKLRATLLRSVRLHWYEPEVTKTEFGLCYLMAQPDQWLCRVVPDVLEPALTVFVECLAAPASPDCFEC